MKIGVITLHYGDLPYFPYSAHLIRSYCARHGYDFIIGNLDQPPLADRNPNWYKVRRVADCLARYDFVVYIDADAWFFDRERRIEKLIADHMDDHTLLLFGNGSKGQRFRLGRRFGKRRGVCGS